MPPAFGERPGFAVGVNNPFKTDAPGRVTCELNNLDPTVYDAPGRYVYALATMRY